MMQLKHPKRGFVALVSIAAIAAGTIAVTWAEQRTDAQRSVTDHPSLFSAPPGCSSPAQSLARAKKAEEHAYFHTERYPYDPQDGIDAVGEFQEAESCYRASGLPEDATRVGRIASNLMARINVDYASSRLVLENALDAEHWALALSEIHRLLRLTEHVRDHAYVAHLSSIVGKVTIRANAAR